MSTELDPKDAEIARLKHVVLRLVALVHIERAHWAEVGQLHDVADREWDTVERCISRLAKEPLP